MLPQNKATTKQRPLSLPDIAWGVFHPAMNIIAPMHCCFLTMPIYGLSLNRALISQMRSIRIHEKMRMK
jgi:hypothetical protein